VREKKEKKNKDLRERRDLLSATILEIIQINPAT
jgi:hypothetical protein